MEPEIDPSNPFPDRSCSIFEVDECVYIPKTCGLERGMEITPLMNLGEQIGCYDSLQVCLHCPVVRFEFGWILFEFCGFWKSCSDPGIVGSIEY